MRIAPQRLLPALTIRPLTAKLADSTERAGIIRQPVHFLVYSVPGEGCDLCGER
jgi:hypothetical protein